MSSSFCVSEKEQFSKYMCVCGTCMYCTEGMYILYSCPWYKTNVYLYNCMFACTIVPIKISQWEISLHVNPMAISFHGFHRLLFSNEKTEIK